MMNECRESDSLIVSVKSSNKICDNKHMAEKMEKRRLAKGNLVRQNKGRTLSWATLQSELNRIRQLAEKDRSIKVSARYYLRQEPSAVVPHAWDLRGGCRVTGIPTATALEKAPIKTGKK